MRSLFRATVLLALAVPQASGAANPWGCQNAILVAVSQFTDAAGKRVVPATVVCAQERGWYNPGVIWNGVLTQGWHDAAVCANGIGEGIENLMGAFGNICSAIAICGETTPGSTKLQAGAAQSIFMAISNLFVVIADLSNAAIVCDESQITKVAGVQCWIQVTDVLFNLISMAKFIDTALTNVEGLEALAEADAAAPPPEPVADAPGGSSAEAGASDGPAAQEAPAPEPTLGTYAGPAVASGAPVERRLNAANISVLGGAKNLVPLVYQTRDMVLRFFNKTHFDWEEDGHRARSRTELEKLREEKGEQAGFADAMTSVLKVWDMMKEESDVPVVV